MFACICLLVIERHVDLCTCPHLLVMDGGPLALVAKANFGGDRPQETVVQTAVCHTMNVSASLFCDLSLMNDVEWEVAEWMSMLDMFTECPAGPNPKSDPQRQQWCSTAVGWVRRNQKVFTESVRCAGVELSLCFLDVGAISLLSTVQLCFSCMQMVLMVVYIAVSMVCKWCLMVVYIAVCMVCKWFWWLFSL